MATLQNVLMISKKALNGAQNYAASLAIWIAVVLASAILASALIILPAGPAMAGSSTIVTETVETTEYEVTLPLSLPLTPPLSLPAQDSFLNQPGTQTAALTTTLNIADDVVMAPLKLDVSQPVVASTPTHSIHSPPSNHSNASGPQYGPFTLIDSTSVEMNGTVDSYSPAAFRRMMKSHKNIRTIYMIDCDGSVDEEANLALARMIRRAGLNTHVPNHGSIRSGAVELFLAGVRHTADPQAQFVVHSWMDEDGMEANDYPPSDPVHREYLGYYAEMGVPADKAAAFYALTNSVPFSQQLVLSRADIARYNMLN